jgi:hypothetical protein
MVIGGAGMLEKGRYDQVRATMLLSVFAFLGSNDASVYSGRTTLEGMELCVTRVYIPV